MKQYLTIFIICALAGKCLAGGLVTPSLSAVISGNAATATTATTATNLVTGALVTNLVHQGDLYVTNSSGNHPSIFLGSTAFGGQVVQMQSSPAGLAISSALTANNFNGSGSGLTGTAASLSIGGNAATGTERFGPGTPTQDPGSCVE